MVTIMTTIKKKKKWKWCFWLTFFASTHKRWRQQLLQWLVQLLPWQWWHWEGDLMSLAHRHLTFWNLLMKIRIGKRLNTNIVYSSTNKFITSQNKTSCIIFFKDLHSFLAMLTRRMLMFQMDKGHKKSAPLYLGNDALRMSGNLRYCVSIQQDSSP